MLIALFSATTALVASPSAAAAAAAAMRSPAPAMAFTSLYRSGDFGWDASRGLYMAPDEDPEIDPRRKNPPSPPSRERRPLAPLPTVGSGDDKVDVISRLLRDRGLVDKLRATESAEALYALLVESVQAQSAA